jgi:hypothetical protein
MPLDPNCCRSFAIRVEAIDDLPKRTYLAREVGDGLFEGVQALRQAASGIGKPADGPRARARIESKLPGPGPSGDGHASVSA